MSLIFDVVRRLEAEPGMSSLTRGFRAEIADAAWMLGRQWQLGEHLGEDASSPVRVHYHARLTPIEPLDGNPSHDPMTTPAEAIVESEPEDFWTAGRRVRAGRRVAQAAQAAGRPLADDDTLLLEELPAPYHSLNGSGYDGRELWRRRAPDALDLDEAWFGNFRPPTPSPRDLWNPAEFAYDADFEAAFNCASGATTAETSTGIASTPTGHLPMALPRPPLPSSTPVGWTTRARPFHAGGRSKRRAAIRAPSLPIAATWPPMP